MKQYLIALDMDGTLLRSDQTISNNTVNVIKRLVQLGHKVVIASGRPLRTILPYYNQLELDTPIVGYNGGAIFKGKSNIEEFAKTFPIEEILTVLNEVGQDKFINYMCESSTTVYLLNNDESFAKWFSYEGLNLVLGDLNKTLKEQPYTMIYKLKNQDLHLLKEATKKLKNNSVDIRFWSGGSFAEFYYPEINKYSTLKKVADFYNIPNERIIAFGDAGNDIPLMEGAGIGVAMQNGIESIKDYADFVTDEDNNNEGIANFLVKYFSL